MVIDGWVSGVASPGAMKRGVEKAAAKGKARLEVLVVTAKPGLDVVVRPPAGLTGRLLVAALGGQALEQGGAWGEPRADAGACAGGAPARG